jgi:hypothetical protein
VFDGVLDFVVWHSGGIFQAYLKMRFKMIERYNTSDLLGGLFEICCTLSLVTLNHECSFVKANIHA